MVLLLLSVKQALFIFLELSVEKRIVIVEVKKSQNGKNRKKNVTSQNDY